LSAYNRTDVEMVHDLIKEGYDAAKDILRKEEINA